MVQCCAWDAKGNDLHKAGGHSKKNFDELKRNFATIQKETDKLRQAQVNLLFPIQTPLWDPDSRGMDPRRVFYPRCGEPLIKVHDNSWIFCKCIGPKKFGKPSTSTTFPQNS